MDKPKAITLIGTKGIREDAQAMIDYLASDNPNEDRLAKYEHALYETTLEAVFGPEVWTWFNERLE